MLGTCARTAAAELEWLDGTALAARHLWVDHSKVVAALNRLHAARPAVWDAKLRGALVSASYSALRLRPQVRVARLCFEPPTADEDAAGPADGEALPLAPLLRAPSVALDLEKLSSQPALLLLDCPPAEDSAAGWRAALLAALEAAGVDELTVINAPHAALACRCPSAPGGVRRWALDRLGFEPVDLSPWGLHADGLEPPTGFACVRGCEGARLPCGLIEFAPAAAAREAEALFAAARARGGLAAGAWRLWSWRPAIWLGGDLYSLPPDWATDVPFETLYAVLQDPPRVHWWEVASDDAPPLDVRHPGHLLLLEHLTQRALGLCHDVSTAVLDLVLECDPCGVRLQLPRKRELRLTAGGGGGSAPPAPARALPANVPWLDAAALPCKRLVLTDFEDVDLTWLSGAGPSRTVELRGRQERWCCRVNGLSMADGDPMRVRLQPCVPTGACLVSLNNSSGPLVVELAHASLEEWAAALVGHRPAAVAELRLLAADLSFECEGRGEGGASSHSVEEVVGLLEREAAHHTCPLAVQAQGEEGLMSSPASFLLHGAQASRTPLRQMNCEVLHLPTKGLLEVEPHHVREVLRILLHTVIFNRALGPVRPKEVDSELFDVTFVSCGDEAVERKVEEKVGQFCAWVDRNRGRRGQVCLSFYERRQKQAWFSKGEERLYWEQWYINLLVLDQEGAAALEEQSPFVSGSLRAQRKQAVQAALEDCLATIVRAVNEKKDHIPPVVSGSAVTFPFDITVAGETGSVFGLDVQWQAEGQSPPRVEQQLLPPMSAAAAALSPALRAAEEALEAALDDGGRRLQLEYARFPYGSAEAGCYRDAEYSDVLPYNSNRVRLWDVRGGSDYINASPLTSAAAPAAAAAAPAAPDPCASGGAGGAGGGVAGSAAAGAAAAAEAAAVEWSYIATQGPLRHTRDAFWQLVAEQGVRCVVMLTNTTDANLHKCAQYFAAAPGTKKTFGRFTVKTLGLEARRPELFVRQLAVVDNGGGDGAPAPAAAVTHYHYTAWPDHGVPVSADLLLDLCEDLLGAGAHAAPILVHCSAGIGRTGVFCVLDIVSRQLRRLAPMGSPAAAAAAAVAARVAPLVARLRAQRAGMVQTPEQYVFCHAALLEFVRRLAARRLEDAGQGPAAARQAAAHGEVSPAPLPAASAPPPPPASPAPPQLTSPE
eukprot:scaffold14.g1068.t1